ncbi:MAG: hypothetical protein ACOC2D_10275, partial [Spirochaetota bacterium]
MEAFIFALDAENVTIEGEGTIWPNGEHEEFQLGKGNDPARPYAIHMIRCRKARVCDCFIDSTDDALCLKSEGEPVCEDVVVSNCIVSSHAGPIASGITGIPGHPVEDVTLRNVRISTDRPGSDKDVTREVPETSERYPINRMLCGNGLLFRVATEPFRRL